MAMTSFLARFGYGTLFAAVLPVALWYWTATLELPLPVFHVSLVGWALILGGAVLMLSAFGALWRIGGGLPMNAFPPPRFVSSNIYGLLPHPIYIGFVLACAGASLAVGSAVGLWVTTPLVALGCLAIVVGYEKPDLDSRFGALRPRPFLSIAQGGTAIPPRGERWGTMLVVLIPWLLAYEGVKLLGVPPDAIDVRLPGEASWPVWPWTEIIYASAYLAVPLAFLLAPTGDRLRGLAVRGVVATVAITLFYLCVPAIAPVRPPTGDGLLARLLALEQSLAAPPVAAFPSFHVVWAGLVAWAVAPRGRLWGVVAWTWAVALSASCITTGMHAIVDVAAGMLLWLPLCRIDTLFRRLLDGCERLADSWSARRIGPLRIISHGVYAGIGGAVGMLGIGWLTQDLFGTALVALAGLIGAGFWAQIVEGSPLLQRPFGYFGYVIGGAGCLLALGATGYPAWQLAAAFCVVGALVHAIGRLRCIVQGCCHGRPVRAELGMRVTNPHSRVCKLAHLIDTPIHATPLYSILANLAIAALLLRLWVLGAPFAFICGMYLVLSGLARFMEEAYRGEPQTKVVGGLAIYQWLAIASVLVGLALSLLPSPAASLPAAFPSPGLLLLALGYGVIFWFAMGVDFPDSNRRFARLSG